jgi:EAL domain-containing protein (putative c-di-GMP-specific phosphodiesterase class I)
VETQAQLTRLRELGCDDAQGFLFSPPVDAETAEMLLKSPIRW